MKRNKHTLQNLASAAPKAALLATLFICLTLGSGTLMAQQILSAQAGALSLGSSGAGTWVPMTNLSLTLPAMSHSQTTALVTLNVPNPYALGSNYPGACFGISVNGAVLTTIACFTAAYQAPPSGGRQPTTLIVPISLTSNTQQIAAVWFSVRNSTVITDTPSTLSAVVLN